MMLHMPQAKSKKGSLRHQRLSSRSARHTMRLGGGSTGSLHAQPPALDTQGGEDAAQLRGAGDLQSHPALGHLLQRNHRQPQIGCVRIQRQPNIPLHFPCIIPICFVQVHVYHSTGCSRSSYSRMCTGDVLSSSMQLTLSAIDCAHRISAGPCLMHTHDLFGKNTMPHPS